MQDAAAADEATRAFNVASPEDGMLVSEDCESSDGRGGEIDVEEEKCCICCCTGLVIP